MLFDLGLDPKTPLHSGFKESSPFQHGTWIPLTDSRNPRKEPVFFGKLGHVWAQYMTRWWQLKYFLFSPLLGDDDPIWLVFFKWVGSTTNQMMIYASSCHFEDPFVKSLELGDSSRDRSMWWIPTPISWPRCWIRKWRSMRSHWWWWTCVCLVGDGFTGSKPMGFITNFQHHSGKMFFQPPFIFFANLRKLSPFLCWSVKKLERLFKRSSRYHEDIAAKCLQNIKIHRRRREEYWKLTTEKIGKSDVKCAKKLPPTKKKIRSPCFCFCCALTR